jgi:hypothetical protein
MYDMMLKCGKGSSGTAEKYGNMHPMTTVDVINICKVIGLV